MSETRPGWYGRFLALWIDYIIQTIPEQQREWFKSRLVKELRGYSLEGRKEGESRNSGCVHELDELVKLDIENPEHLARLIKEGIHLMYQKQTASHVLNSLLENL